MVMLFNRVALIAQVFIKSNSCLSAANQISQKLKNTYKSHTSRIVSSFRPQSSSCQMRRNFRGHRDGVWEVNVSKIDGQIIGTASADQTCRIWWTQNSSCLLQYCGHSGSVNSVRFHPSQDLVLTASGDNTAHVWRAHVNKPLLAESSVSVGFTGLVIHITCSL